MSGMYGRHVGWVLYLGFGFTLFYKFVCWQGHTRCQETTMHGSFSRSIVWVLGIELKSPAWQREILPVQPSD